MTHSLEVYNNSKNSKMWKLRNNLTIKKIIRGRGQLEQKIRYSKSTTIHYFEVYRSAGSGEAENSYN